MFRRITLAVLVAIALSAVLQRSVLAGGGCNLGGSSLFQYFGGSSHELRMDVGVACTAASCGLFNVEIDWDDGNWSSDDGYTPYSQLFSHVYATGGTYHTKLYADDDMGNTCVLEWGAYNVQ